MPVSPATDTKSGGAPITCCATCQYSHIEWVDGTRKLPLLVCGGASLLCHSGARYAHRPEWVPRSKFNTDQWRLIQGDHVLAIVEPRYDLVQHRDRYLARWCRKGHRIQQVWGDTMTEAVRALGESP